MQFLAWRTGPDTGLLSFLGEHARINFLLCGVLEYTALLGAEVRLRLELCSFDLYVVYSLQLSILHINMVDRTHQDLVQISAGNDIQSFLKFLFI